MRTRRAIPFLSAAVLCATNLTGCSPDLATAPVSIVPSRPSTAIAPGLTSAPLLYDQSSADQGGTTHNGPNTYYADDFVVPVGETWTVAQVVVSGRLLNGTTELPIAIYPDAGGKPGAAALSGSVTNTPTSQALNPCCSPGPNPVTDFLFTLPTPVTLPAGTYWVAARVSAGLTSSFMWHTASTPRIAAGGASRLDDGEAWSSEAVAQNLGFAVFGSPPGPVQQAQVITFPAIAPNQAIVNGTAALSATASSNLPVTFSAIQSAGVCTVSGTTVSFVGVGTCTIAADQSGDAAYQPAAQVTRSVKVDYQFAGFAQPVDNTVLNAAKAGQAIPLRWRVTDANGAPVTTLTTATITAASLVCNLGSTTDLVEEYAAGSSGLQNLGNGHYQLNWKTPTSYARSCKTLQLNLGEGSGPRTAQFQFTR